MIIKRLKNHSNNSMKFMKNVNNNLIKLTLIMFFSFFTYVNAVEFRGAAVESYKGSSTKKKINETLENAKAKACKNAFRKYVQEMEESKRMIFVGIEDQIYSNLNEYMVCETIVEENIKKKEKKVEVVMKANIDETRLDIEIKKNSKVFDSKSSEKSKLAMIFFSRTVAAQRQYDEKVTKVEKKTKGIDINEEETDTGISSSTTETNVSETGGSKLKKADISEYIVDDNDTVKLEAGMKEIFTKARFEPISGPRQLRRNWRSLKGDIVDSLENGGSIPEEVKWEIEDILMEKNVSYVVFAYFDVGVPEVDAATGNQVVNAALAIAEISRLGNGDPISLGTISGVQMRGKGSNNDIAKNNAISLVSQETAKKLVALINSKGIN
tara:strand:+ start:747 stop:1892 length:1146 start_codon:yes stop_codon:yes gene_type:complete